MNPYEIRSQFVAKRAFAVAAVADLGVLLVGPLGSSKTTLREAFPLVRSAEREPCPCGHLGDVRRECTCNPIRIARWHRRLERDARAFEIVLEACAAPVREMMGPNRNTPADDESMQARIASAREFGDIHTSLDLADDGARRTVEMVARRLSLTFGEYNAMLRVARAIANLDHSDNLLAKHIAEAVQYSAALLPGRLGQNARVIAAK